MSTKQIAEGVYLLSLNVESILFEGMWNLEGGVTLNSYVVKAEKPAVIDGFIGWDGVPETLYTMLEETGLKPEHIRVLVVNHMEPDHSGWLLNFLKINSDVDIYCSKESAALLKAFFGITERVHEVTDGASVDLGDRSLSFHKAGNIHWPDTMMTLDSKTKTLFTCDNFGAFGVLERLVSSEYSEAELKALEQPQRRYYSNILATFSPMVQKGIDKAKALEPSILAPGHGLVWDDRHEIIYRDYEHYVLSQKGQGKNKIALLWGSMYGMTEEMVHFAEELLRKRGMDFVSLKIPGSDLSTVLMEAWDCKGLIVAAPTYEYKMFPLVASVLDELGKKRLYNRKAVYFGSFGWSGGALKEYNEILERNRMNFETIDGIEFNGKALAETKDRITQAIDQLIAKVNE